MLVSRGFEADGADEGVEVINDALAAIILCRLRKLVCFCFILRCAQRRVMPQGDSELRQPHSDQ